MSLWKSAFLGMILSVLFTGATIVVARRRGWVVVPRSDRWSTRPVAQFGGVAILISFLVGGLSGAVSPHALVLCFLTLLMGALGLWDDIHSLGPRFKLLAQTALAFLVVCSGLVYPATHSLATNMAITVVLIVGITNAFNLLDNIDGLAAGIGLITAATLLLLQGLTLDGNSQVAALAGSLLGYLFFNFHPAKIFMGDTGSLAMGFFLACAFVSGGQHASTTYSVLLSPLLVLFLPIFDTVLVSITRRLNGRRISSGAKDHSSHRLVLLGFSERNAVLVLYALASLGGGAAWVWKVRPQIAPGVSTLFLGTGALFWFYLARIRLPEECLSARHSAADHGESGAIRAHRPAATQNK